MWANVNSSTTYLDIYTCKDVYNLLHMKNLWPICSQLKWRVVSNHFILKILLCSVPVLFFIHYLNITPCHPKSKFVKIIFPHYLYALVLYYRYLPTDFQGGKGGSFWIKVWIRYMLSSSLYNHIGTEGEGHSLSSLWAKMNNNKVKVKILSSC